MQFIRIAGVPLNDEGSVPVLPRFCVGHRYQELYVGHLSDLDPMLGRDPELTHFIPDHAQFPRK